MGRRIVIGVVLLLVAGGGWYGWNWFYGALPIDDPDVLARARAATAAQDESAMPTHRAERVIPEPDALRNVYFGGLHVHTAMSFDAYLFRNRFGLDEAYRFANGEALELTTGEVQVLSRPLDFVALTDHSESFAMDAVCGGETMDPRAEDGCNLLEVPSRGTFLEIRNQAAQRPMERSDLLCPEGIDCLAAEDSTWQKIRDAADRYDAPGEFTAFIAYEYSPVLADTGKLHRNVIFRGSDVLSHATSA